MSTPAGKKYDDSPKPKLASIVASGSVLTTTTTAVPGSSVFGGSSRLESDDISERSSTSSINSTSSISSHVAHSPGPPPFKGEGPENTKSQPSRASDSFSMVSKASTRRSKRKRKFAAQKGGTRKLKVKVKSKKFKKTKVDPAQSVSGKGQQEPAQLKRPSFEEIAVSVDNNFVETTAAGLEVLESSDHIYVVRKRQKLPFPHDEPSRSHFQILNGSGKHIFTTAQVDFEFRARKFVMDLFSTDGEPILLFFQRSIDGFRSLNTDWEQTMEYYSKDENLPTSVPYVNRSGFIAYIFQTFDDRVTLFETWSKEEKPQAYVHIRHVDGKFLGHIWKGIKSWIVYDSSIGPQFIFQETHCHNPISFFTETPRRKIWWGWIGRLYSYYEFYAVPAPPRSTEDYLIDSPLGVIEANLNLEHLGVNEKPMDCFGASFPQHLTNVEKVLILGMLLSLYCRTTACYSGYKILVYTLLASIIFIAFIAIVSISVCYGIYGNFCE